ncbi:MAG: phosphoesterase [Isosphaeraceae bacterium]|nr:phosphoesterase [Isosphaeraceae bacterium]
MSPGFCHLPFLDGWCLAPEGAAVHVGEQTAVIADVHLGYEWARAAGGDVVPAHSLAETLAKLEALLDRAALARLVVAGDLVESPGPCRRIARDVQALVTWLARRGVELLRLRGDHDPRVPPLPLTCTVAGWTIGHGHRPLRAGPTLFGHYHPVLRAEGLTAPCFLVGPAMIALPAFSPNAAGLSVTSAALPAALRAEGLHCVAGVGAELLDFGPLAALAATRRGGGVRP